MADAQADVDVAYEVIYVRKPRRRLLFFLRDAMLDLLVARLGRRPLQDSAREAGTDRPCHSQGEAAGGELRGCRRSMI